MAEPFVLELSDGLTWIVEPPTDPYGDGYVRKAHVELRADGLAAKTIATLHGHGVRDLASFFEDLATDWRGWAGKRDWRALEGEMAIEAWHDGLALVTIAVTVKRQWQPFADDAWSARVVFTLEAGEQLRATAQDLARLLGD
jgi:hypothetical protein